VGGNCTDSIPVLLDGPVDCHGRFVRTSNGSELKFFDLIGKKHAECHVDAS
jgi:hypothetical protein